MGKVSCKQNKGARAWLACILLDSCVFRFFETHSWPVPIRRQQPEWMLQFLPEQPLLLERNFHEPVLRKPRALFWAIRPVQFALHL